MDPIKTRLGALAELRILDTEPEPAFDSLVRLAASMFAAPVALITFMDDRRQWFKARVGTDLHETPLVHAICLHAVSGEAEVFEVLDARQDPRFADNPFVMGPTNLRYYAGAPICAPDGTRLGSLCVMDTAPRPALTPEQAAQLICLARAVNDALRLRMELNARQAAEARLAESEARYRHLANHCHDILLRADREGRVLYASPSCRSLGYEPEEVVGRDLADFASPRIRPQVRKALRNLFSDEAADEVVQPAYPAVNRAGEEVWFEGASTLVRDADGLAREVVSVYRDVTAQRALQAQLEAAVEEKAAFLANMSHELRTPLTSILGFTALLSRSEQLPESAARHVSRIASAGEALLALINNILDVSKLEAGQIALEPAPTDIAALARGVSEMLAAQAQVKGLTLEVVNRLQSGRRQTDSLRLRQILVNLAGNAVKFTHRGSVRIELTDAPEGRLRIEVIDTGPGLPPDYRTRLFRRFSQGGLNVTREHGGSGLGLAICQELVELMQGEIGAENREGGGARFWLEIAAPVCAEAAAPPAAAPEPPPPAPRSDAVKGRVLIVDDHPVNRELVRLLLAGPGIEIAEAEDGRLAVEQAARQAFDLILMDVNMPVMDGLAAASAIRAGCPLNAEAPIVALTAQTGEAIAEKCFAAGMDAILAKPLQAPELTALVAQALEARKTPMEAKAGERRVL